MSDAREIVGDYARLVRSAELEPGVVGLSREYGERLVAALDAAIDLVADVESSGYTGWERVQERYRKMDALRDALSALGVTVKAK